jgi:hypothetical protein
MLAQLTLTVLFNLYETTQSNNSHFINSIALEKGGALRYNMYRPLLHNNQFINNSALYGPNIASYPINLLINSTYLTNITLPETVSGQKYPQHLNISLIDYDNQIMILDNASTISIKGTTSGSLTEGTTITKVKQGTAVLDNLIFVYKPGGNNILYNITSNAIEYAKVQILQNYQYGVQVHVSFRFCKPGEFESNSR